MTTAPRTNPHAGLPITDSDEAIAAYLDDLSVPALAMSVVHMTGDRSILDGPVRPKGLVLNQWQGFLDDDEQAEIRRLALAAIIAYRDGGCVLPPPPSSALIREMMSWLAADDVPDEYVPMMLEEMELDGADAREVDLSVGAEQRSEFPVVVIGCGQSGLLAAIRLKEAGIPYTVIEKNPDVGGTWYENAYPGCRVDVGNHFYCYSFEPSDGWTEFFSQQPELQQYFHDVMERQGVKDDIRFDTEVTSARWDEASGMWKVAIRNPDGSEEVLDARALISAVGQLNRPSIPDFPGMETFAGPSFHSAKWDHSLDLTGKRVAMIGAGASGFQIAPTIAPDVAQLTVFQRTAQWMFPNPNYHAKVGPGVAWAIRHLPFYGRWFRFLIFWSACDGGLARSRIDPEWPDQQRSISAANDVTRQVFTEWITSQIGDDPELLAKVIPDYPATAKRTLQDNGSWLRTLKRDNVDLVREGIDHIEPNAIVATDGTRYEVDVIIYATGFKVNQFLWPMDIVGRDGTVLAEQWGDEPAAYLGITVPNFPNLFCMYGPGTNLAHGGSLIFHSECQIRYITKAIDHLLANDAVAMEPKQSVHDEYYQRTQAELKCLVWSTPAVKHSFYKNPKGDIHLLSPWRLVDYWGWTQAPNPDDFIVA